ncbi:MAG TPA: hypothetical protein VF188_11295 [Longimicrobiales bacterium]
MAGTAEREARRALMRLRRTTDKAARELETLEAALRDADGDDFPADVFQEAADHLHAVGEFIDEQEERLQARLLEAGGVTVEHLRREDSPED